jgi:hypothetical protein
VRRLLKPARRTIRPEIFLKCRHQFRTVSRSAPDSTWIIDADYIATDAGGRATDKGCDPRSAGRQIKLLLGVLILANDNLLASSLLVERA